MKHLNKIKEFGRVRNQRKALFKTMLGSLIMHEKIETTEAKAKALKEKIDRIINKAKNTKNDSKKISAIRDLKKYIPEIAIRKIIGEYLENFKERKSGYSRVIKLAPRKSDGARMAVIELISK